MIAFIKPFNLKERKYNMGKLIEGLWDCSYCGTKRNRGSIRECPNCGHPRDENTKFYMPETIAYVPNKKARTINRNPNWVCPYCNSLNSDSLSNCPSCGSVRTEKNLDYFSIKKQDHSDGSENDSAKVQIETQINIDNPKHKFESHSKKGFWSHLRFSKDYWKSLIVIPLILALICGMVYLLIPKNEEITITGFKWERFIDIERYQTVEETGWFLPTGARLKYTNTEISHYETVLDHYETKTQQVAKERISGYEDYVSGYRDLGNGYFEEIISQRPIYETYYETETYQEPVYREEPVYATKYYYEIDKWLYERTISTNEQNQEPYWGKVNLNDDERISLKTEKYYIIGLNPKGKEKTISLSYEDWLNLSVNQTVKMKTSIFGDGELIE